MKPFRKFTAVLTAAILMLSLLLSGCGSIGDTLRAGADRPLFTVGEETCSTSEAKLYLVTLHNTYHDYLGTDLWEENTSGGTDASGDVGTLLSDYTTNVTLDRLETVYALDLLADQLGVSLTDDEQSRIAQAASYFYNSLSDTERAYFRVGEDDIEEYYTHFALAEKAYEAAAASGDAEVTDDEARVIQLKITHTSDASIVEASQPDESGNAATYDELSAAYSPEEGNQTQNISRGDLPEDIEETAYQLVNGEMSDLLQTSEDGSYYLLVCVSEDAEDLTAQHKAEMIKEKQESNFDAVYEPFLETLNFKLNDKVWERLQDIPDNVTTTDFFSAYNSYFPSSDS